ncbi:MAG: hypothetical protein KJ795_07440 [Gammaproteobacteria bacterium]|nr:hypothetical protein [Gammaproteobacteria bacterium]MBU1969819.1 hypothetical protein [Gammaproteobacteria bacterium]
MTTKLHLSKHDQIKEAVYGAITKEKRGQIYFKRKKGTDLFDAHAASDMGSNCFVE